MLTGDAATILAKNVYDPEDIVVPMTPFNLAAHILLADDASLEWDVIPESVSAEVPNPYPLGKSDLACSKAESVCPDDCPEGPLCTMTGAPRAPLYDELARVHVGDRPLLVLRSSQILPGVGGYEMRALRELSHLIADGLNLVAVSCKCHGIISALRRKARKDGDRQNGGFHRQ
jgi:hypothetical protein